MFRKVKGVLVSVRPAMGRAKGAVALLAPTALLASSMASAQSGGGLGIADAVTATITSASSDVKAIGIAVIGVVVLVVAFNLARRAIH